MRVAVGLLYVMAFLGCDRGVDVVAYSLEAPSDGDPSVAAPGVAAPGDDAGTSESALPSAAATSCSDANTLALMTQTGDLHRFDLVTNQALGEGAACVATATLAGPIALDRSGTVWAETAGAIVATPDGVQCKNTGLSLTATSMGFVYDATSASESLYAVVDGVLVVINEGTFARTPIGKLALDDVRGLAGTSDGRLFAFAGGDLVTIAEIALGDASVAAAWQVKAPRDLGGRFAGGVVTQAGFELVFGPYAYDFAPATGALTLKASIFPTDPGLVAISAAPCFARAK
jgi:hypothetical protein